MPQQDEPKSTGEAIPRTVSKALTDSINVIHSEDLFQGKQELLIQHGDQLYRLRQTRNGKLILTK